MRQLQTIFILTPSEFGFAREIVRGVRSYALSHGRWSLRCGTIPKGAGISIVTSPNASGAILFCSHTDLEDAVLERGACPVVNVSARMERSRLPQVVPDNVEAGRLAAQHLLDRGFRHFAFAGHPSYGYGKARKDGFTQVLQEHGYTCELGKASYGDISAWIANLPKPIGILASNDVEAQRAVDACYDLEIAVPEQVAVVGVDNDEHVCETTHAPISSVDTRGYDVGYRAGELLDALIAGEPAPDSPIVVPVGQMVTRRSTDTVAVADPDIAFAARYIREHACDPLRIDSMMEHLSIGRRTLEKRFKNEFKRTLHNEIRRVQLNRARELLIETELQIPVVAERSGFCDRKIFTKVFSQAEGMPPGQFRIKHRRR